MELPIHRLCLLIFIIHTGLSQKQCEVQIVSSVEFAPFNEWFLLNCTYTCSRPSWESSLQRRNTQEGDHWVSTEFLVNDWEKSSISCVSGDEEDIVKSTVTVTAYALPSKVTIDLDEELEEGEAHEVTCTVYEVAPLANLRLSVMIEGKVIDTLTFTGDNSKGKQSLSETFYFTVSQVDNQQDFYCQAILELGVLKDNLVESKKINVEIYAKPDIPAVLITPATTVEEVIIDVTAISMTPGMTVKEAKPDDPVISVKPSTNVPNLDVPAISITPSINVLKPDLPAASITSSTNVEEGQPDTPFILALPNETVIIGESLNLTCHSDGFPEPEYFWTIPSKNHVLFSADGREIFITKTTSAHHGVYKCEAHNTYGSVSNQLVITIIGQPNGVSLARPTAILFASSLAIALL